MATREIRYRDPVTGERKRRFEEYPDPTPEEVQASVDTSREQTAGQFDSTEDILRAAMLVVQEETNRIIVGYTALRTACINATRLAALRSGATSTPDIPQKTPAQLRAAIRAKLGT